MINKIFESLQSAVADVHDGATVMIGGFGTAGMPSELIDALIEQGARELTIVNNNAGNGDTGLAALLNAKRVRKIICSFPRQTDSYVFDALYRAGEIELELVPQGNLAERIRAAGAGIGGFFTPTGYGTKLAQGKETRVIDGRHYVLEKTERDGETTIGVREIVSDAEREAELARMLSGETHEAALAHARSLLRHVVDL